MDQSALPDADPVEYHIWQLFNQKKVALPLAPNGPMLEPKTITIFLQDYNSGQLKFL